MAREVEPKRKSVKSTAWLIAFGVTITFFIAAGIAKEINPDSYQCVCRAKRCFIIAHFCTGPMVGLVLESLAILASYLTLREFDNLAAGSIYASWRQVRIYLASAAMLYFAGMILLFL